MTEGAEKQARSRRGVKRPPFGRRALRAATSSLPQDDRRASQGSRARGRRGRRRRRLRLNRSCCRCTHTLAIHPRGEAPRAPPRGANRLRRTGSPPAAPLCPHRCQAPVVTSSGVTRFQMNFILLCLAPARTRAPCQRKVMSLVRHQPSWWPDLAWASSEHSAGLHWRRYSSASCR